MISKTKNENTLVFFFLILLYQKWKTETSSFFYFDFEKSKTKNENIFVFRFGFCEIKNENWKHARFSFFILGFSKRKTNGRKYTRTPMPFGEFIQIKLYHIYDSNFNLSQGFLTRSLIGKNTRTRTRILTPNNPTKVNHSVFT